MNEYALAAMDKHLFVSKHQIELPKQEIRRFPEEPMQDVASLPRA